MWRYGGNRKATHQGIENLLFALLHSNIISASVWQKSFLKEESLIIFFAILSPRP